MSKKVYALGESILDIVFTDQQVRSAIPGGSMLNAAVSLGRVNADISLITELGRDQAGDLIEQFLMQNGVNTRYVYKYEDGKTALAMAFLNSKKDASYDFYKFYPEDRLAIDCPLFVDEDIFLFGSYFGIDPMVCDKVYDYAQKARQSGALIVYDPNFRKSHIHLLHELRPTIIRNMQLADIIRASDEDLQIIFDTETIDELQSYLDISHKIVIKTCNNKGVFLKRKDHTFFFPSQKIEPVSTIGAGDNFNAGLVYGLIKYEINKRNLHQWPEHVFEKLIFYAIEFASDVCKSYENYISKELINSFNHSK